MKYDVVIVASGKGERANLGYNKAFFKTKDGRTVLERSSSLFINDTDCNNVIIVTNEEYFDQVFENKKIIKTVGGKERRNSVFNGLQKVTSEYVLIHDAARPFLQKEALEELKKEVKEKNAAILAHKATDTIKVVRNNKIKETIDRNTIFMAETPQGFKTDLIKECYKKCEDINFTDDASLVESLGYDVFIVEDKYNNLKLTSEMDFKNLWLKKLLWLKEAMIRKD